MTIKLIKTKKDYQQAIARLEIIFDAKKGSPKGDELEILGMLVENYENENFPVGFLEVMSALASRMSTLDLGLLFLR